MCGGDSDGERTGEEVMIYSWRTWLGLSRAAVREERWRWRPGLDQEPTGARQVLFSGQLRANASRTSYFLPLATLSHVPLSHHFFRAPPQPAQSPRPSHASGRPAVALHAVQAQPPRHPATPALVVRQIPVHPPSTPCHRSQPARLRARSPRPSSPPAPHRPPPSRCTRPHDRAAVTAGRTHTLSQRP